MPEQPERPRVRILVVDDNKDVADSLVALFELMGAETRIAYDGVAGLAVAREWEPDCVMSDIKMPNLNGYDLARQMRADPRLAKAKLVCLSAFEDERHQREAQEAGFDHILTKPASPEELEEVLGMVEEIKALAEKTRDLAAENVKLAGETKELIQEVKEDIQEVKEDVRELKQDVQELKADRDKPDPEK
jgi:two-component system OmpR family response regulator